VARQPIGYFVALITIQQFYSGKSAEQYGISGDCTLTPSPQGERSQASYDLLCNHPIIIRTNELIVKFESG